MNNGISEKNWSKGFCNKLHELTRIISEFQTWQSFDCRNFRISVL